MGCIPSKVMLARTASRSSTTHHHHRHLLAFLSPSQPTISALHLDHNLTDFEDAKHTIDALELMPDSNNHDIMAMDVDYKSNCNNDYSKRYQSSPNEYDNKITSERCASFHTVEEYDALIQTISTSGEKEVITIDDEKGIRRKKAREALAGSLNVEFQTVGSLRQWLDDHAQSPVVGGCEPVDYPTPKFGSYTHAPVVDSVFAEYTSTKQQEEESVPEVDPDLVAAFEEYMQQLQDEEDNILKMIGADDPPA